MVASFETACQGSAKPLEMNHVRLHMTAAHYTDDDDVYTRARESDQSIVCFLQPVSFAQVGGGAVPTQPPCPAMKRPRPHEAGSAPQASKARIGHCQFRGGTVDYALSCSHLTSGPGTLAELMDFRGSVNRAVLDVRTAAGRERRERLQQMISHGFVVSSDYSGKQTPEHLLQYMFVSWRAAELHQLDAPLVFYRCCECQPACQKILVAEDTRLSEHVFPDIQARVPPQHREALRQLEPTSRADPRDRASVATARACYQRVADYLLRHWDECFNAESVSSCLVHPGQLCRVNRGRIDSDSHDHPQPSLHIAGAVCSPWSLCGSRLGLADPITKVWHIWSVERSAADEDFVVLEQAPEFPLDVLGSVLAPTHDVRAVIFGPEQCGWPINRDRTYAWCCNRRTMVWVGPEDPGSLRADFSALFRVRCQLDADVFVLDDEAAVRQQLAQLAKARKVFLNSSIPVRDINVRDLLSPSGKERFDGYAAQFQQGRACSMSGAFVCDLSQNPALRPRSGPWLPTLLKNSQLYSFSQRHLFTPLELLQAHGWPTLVQGGSPPASPPSWMHRIGHGRQNVSARAAQMMIGNGMHLHPLCAWITYCLANCVRRELISGARDDLVFLRSLGPYGDSEQPESERLSRGSGSAASGSAQPACERSAR